MRYQVTAVVVSYNREELLKECLDALNSQTRKPDSVIVVDNASTDGSLKVAQSHPIHAEVVELPENLGGAGGFCAGVAKAVAPLTHATHSQTVPLVWLMDDDTIPLPTALEELLAAEDASVQGNGVLPVALGSKAIWTDGREHLMNRPKERALPVKGNRELPGFDGAFQVRSLSFVSCLVNANAVLGLHRLPRAAYFLWNDDYEFTTALLKNGIGYYVPDSEVMHKTKVFGSSDANPGARFYYEVRNKIWLLRFSAQNFSLAGRAVYLAKTARRWLLTLARHHDDEMFDCLRRGWHDGWRTVPKTNEEIFAGVPQVEHSIREITLNP